MEYAPQTLKKYIEDNYQHRDLNKYYFKTFRNTRIDRIKPVVNIYERYEKSGDGVELGEEGCNVRNPCKFARTPDEIAVSKINCKLFGTKKNVRPQIKYSQKVFGKNMKIVNLKINVS